MVASRVISGTGLASRHGHKEKHPFVFSTLYATVTTRLFWCTDLLGSVGHFVQEVALFWITYEITGSAMALGILGLCSALPRLILGALSGVLVDRYDRKLLLILVQFCLRHPDSNFSGDLCFRHARVLAPARAGNSLRLDPRDQSFGGAIDPWGIGAAGRYHERRLALHCRLQHRSHRGTVPRRRIDSFDRHRRLLRDIRCNPFDLRHGHAVYSHAKREPSIKREENFLREFKEGFHYVWHAPVILSSIVAAYTFAVFIVTYQSFLPVFAKEVLQVGPEGLGILMAAPGLGGIASLSFLASVGERWNRAMLLWIMTTTTPIFLMLFCVSPIFWLSVLLLALVGAGQVCFRTISRVIIQIEAPRNLMGRVMSVFNLDQGMRSIGSIVLGASATLFGASLGLALTAAVSLIVTTALFYRLLGKKI